MPIVEFLNLNKYGNIRTRRFYQEKSNLSINPKGLGKFIAFKLFKYDYKHHMPPSLANIENKRYIMPTWEEVLPETTLKDINWIKPKIKTKINSQIITQTHISKSGGGEYTTKYYPNSDKYYCSCPGYWRSKGNCKHIKEMKNE